MGKVKDVVSNTVQMLEVWQKQAESLVSIIDELQSYLEEGPRTVIEESLDRLLSRIRAEVAKMISGSGVVLVSPEGRVSVGETYSDEESDPWLKRLKSKGFFILTLEQFRAFVQSLKSEAAGGNLIPIIELLRANTKFEWPSVYSPAPALRGSQFREPSSSEWKLSDFLPALPPHPPLPRGLFKD
ncbi:unnamed protein product [marine sediment metagenome]|uniref:Uncharacterized protein n=1 Tax=marine sediment metagenome TaxID=412755 RepID=X1HWI5_9ZZZZ